MTSLLNSLGILEIQGADASQYLQGQLTADVNTLTDTQASVTALCDAKGRVQVSAIVFRVALTYYCLVPHSMVSPALTRLKKYALFSKVTCLDVSDGWHVAALRANAAATAPPFILQRQDQVLQLSLPGQKQRLLLLSQDEAALIAHVHHCQQQGFQTVNDTEWEYDNIEARLANVTPHTQAQFTPQMLELEKLGGVSFSKGCYVGQEIVARTQHLGKLKRHLHRITWQDTPREQPCAGVTLSNTLGETVGMLVNASENMALAVIEDRALNDMLMLCETPIRIV